MIFSFYRRLALPLAFFLFRLLLPVLPDKVKTVWRERETWRPQGSARHPVILIHAASGEIEYAKPVLRELRKRWPKLSLVVSYFSPSAHRLHHNLDVDEIVPFPLDRPTDVRRFLDHYQPRMVLIARSDLWPEFLHQCRERKIPTALFSATASPESKNPLSLSLRKFCLSELTLIGCVSAEDTMAFQRLTSTPVLTLGDTRYEQTLERLRQPKKLSCEKEKSARRIGILGSTWSEDDRVWLSALANSKAKTSGLAECRWIWAPHEISEGKLASLESELQKQGLSAQRYSKEKIWSADILLVDQVGILAELYTWADFAFVGGSFVRKVHSVMEPLAAGLPVLVGPHHRNNREAIEFQKIEVAHAFYAVTVLEKPDDIHGWFGQFLKVDAHGIRKMISQQVEQRAQATNQLIDLLKVDQVIAPR